MLYKQREILHNIQNSANPHNAEQAVVQCEILSKLFSNSDFCEHCVFTGGGTLTLSYNILARQNNDIDLAVNNFKPLDSFSGRFEKQLAKFRHAFRKHIFGPMYEQVTDMLSDYSDILILTDKTYCINAGTTPQPTLHIFYPSMTNETPGHICLEFSPRIYTPDIIDRRPIIIPYTMNTQTISIPTVRPEQTFWDKLYALHTFFNVSKLFIRPTISRHYYDVARITQTNKIDIQGTQHMLQNIAAFQETHSQRGIPRPHSPADLNLVPHADLYTAIKQDYDTISATGILPRNYWNKIIHTLIALENKLRQTQR